MKDPEFVGDLDQGIRRRKESYPQFDYKTFGSGASPYSNSEKTMEPVDHFAVQSEYDFGDQSVDLAMPGGEPLAYVEEGGFMEEPVEEHEGQGGEWELMGMNEEELVSFFLRSSLQPPSFLSILHPSLPPPSPALTNPGRRIPPNPRQAGSDGHHPRRSLRAPQVEVRGP